MPSRVTRSVTTANAAQHHHFVDRQLGLVSANAIFTSTRFCDAVCRVWIDRCAGANSFFSEMSCKNGVSRPPQGVSSMSRRNAEIVPPMLQLTQVCQEGYVLEMMSGSD